MKIGSRVRIDRHDYSVVYGDPKRIAGADREAVGHCDGKKKLITLCPSLKRDEYDRLWVFFHEVGHAWNFEFGVGLTHPQIERLGRVLALFVMDNRLEMRGPE